MRQVGKVNLPNALNATKKPVRAKADAAAPLAKSASSCACGGTCPSCRSKLASLPVSEPGDSHEREADRLAEMAMRGSTPVPPVNARTTLPNAQPVALPSGDAEIGLAGKPLSSEQLARFEPALGADLSGIRIHSGREAQALTGPLQAEAFTLGRHIVIGDENFQAESPHGRNLLAHELVHSIQQRAVTSVQATQTATPAQPTIMRRTLRNAKLNFLCGTGDAESFVRSPPSGFMHLNAGETQIDISTNIVWDRPATCGPGGTVSVTLKRSRSLIWDANEGERSLPVGSTGSGSWSGLTADADYYLEIRSANSNPNCCLTGTLDITTP
jgi:hypothetical protein